MTVDESISELERFVKMKTTLRPVFVDVIENAAQNRIGVEPLQIEDTFAVFRCPICKRAVGCWNLEHTKVLRQEFCGGCGKAVKWDNIHLDFMKGELIPYVE